MPVPLLVAAGTALAVAGSVKQMGAAKDMKEAQQQEITGQQQIEAQKRQQMELEHSRQQMEILRNTQRARSLALATATNQGAQGSSVLAGAYGGISGQGNNQELAANQNYQIGQNIFGFNSDISQARISYAGAQSSYQSGAALSSLGGALVSNAGSLNAVGQSSGAALGRAMSFGTGPGSGIFSRS